MGFNTKKHKLIFAVVFFINLTLSIVDNNISHPTVYKNKELITSRIQAQDRKFSISFPNIDYELDGQVYQTHTSITGDQLYNPKNYNLSDSCLFYPTNFDLNVQYSIDFDYIAQQSIVLEKQKLVYVIGYEEPSDYNNPVQRFIKIYSFCDTKLNQIQTKSLGQTILKTGFEQNSFLLNFNQSVFISDGNTIYQTKVPNNSTQQIVIMQGLNSNQNTQDYQFLGMVIQNNSLVLLYQNKIAAYSIISQNGVYKLSLNYQIQKDDKLFYDVQFSKEQIFILSQNVLKIYKKSALTTHVDIQMEGDFCSRIYLYGDVLQIVCSYKQMTYVAQYQYDSLKQSITLNRYYNDINDYRLIQFLGNNHDKILMIGDDQIILTNFAINREILMDIEDPTGNSQVIYSFGMQRIQTLSQYSNKQSTVILGVSEDYIVVVKLAQIPPQIQCNIKSSDFSYINLLVVSNTSKCQFNINQSPLSSICTNLKPIEIFISAIEIQKKMSVLFILLIVIMVFVIIFFCMGWVFKANLNHKKLIESIKKKIKKLKSAKKQIKQI